jgi:hypothetical protein
MPLLTMKTFLSLILAWLFVIALLYASWLLAKWLDPTEMAGGFFSAGGIILALECFLGLFLLVLTAAYLLRAPIKRILHSWRERR